MAKPRASALSLVGRTAECDVLDRLVAGARAGQSGVLVLRGEAGVGKTALLEHLVESARGCRIAQAAGVEAEMELAFAGLHQLAASMLDRIEQLPEPQAQALGTAFGLHPGAAPDRFLVGLAMLSLLADAAEDQPLVCLIDDVQWLDRVSTQVLTFVARRLLAERIAIVFAAREPSTEEEFRGLPGLRVTGLDGAEAGTLLDSVIRGRVDAQVRERILAESQGNPLALLELHRGLAPAQMGGGFGLPLTMPMATRIERGFVRQLELLPPDTRRFLLVAAVEPVGDVTLLWRAAKRLGLEPDVADPAEAAGLVEVGARVRFRHPLVRSAICRAVPAIELQAVHRALAEETDPEVDPDRRAWHRAEAAVGPDEAVAEELERSAGRAQDRGGGTAAAAFLERATALTPDPVRRGARALAAAEAMHYAASAPEAASQLLAIAESCPLDPQQRALLERHRAQLAFSLGPASDALPMLLVAAERLEKLDPRIARDTYLDALGACVFAGRAGDEQQVQAAAGAARSAVRGPEPPRPSDLLLDGLARRLTDGFVASVPFFRLAVDAFAEGRGRVEDDVQWLWLATPAAHELWDDEAWDRLTGRAVELARAGDNLTALPISLLYRAFLEVHTGHIESASGLLDEADEISQATGNPPLAYVSPVVAAWRGAEDRASELIDFSRRSATARHDGRTAALADYSSAVLLNGLGRYDEAASVAQRACEHDDLGLTGWCLAELVEAAARSDRLDVSAHAMQRLGERTGCVRTDWALGIEFLCRALLADDEHEVLYRQALDHLGRTRIKASLARAHLLFGEWLRREGHRIEAREQLRTAHVMLNDIGAEAFAERARRELVATGETVRKRSDATRSDLTAQEAQIARLASERLTNPEIAARMFLSARTVEWHLSHVFTKLGIASRKDLSRALGGEGRAASLA